MRINNTTFEHPIVPEKPTAWIPVGRRRPLLLAGLLVYLPSCGVTDFPHDQPVVNPNNDFGPTSNNPPMTTEDAAPSQVPAQDAASPGTMRDASGAPSDQASPPTNPRPDAGGAPATVTLSIGGKDIPKENAIAFIHLGHSNMAGRGITPPASRPYHFTTVDPFAWMYHVGMPLQPALEPTAGDNYGTYAGPGTALLKQAAALAPGKYFISLGFGQGSAYCSQFLPGALYYDSVMAAPKAIKDRVTFGGIVIMLGITERHGTAADISGYPDCINQLVTAIRKDVDAPNLPLLLTDYEQGATGQLAPTTAFAQTITPLIRKVPSVVTNSAIVPTDGLGMEDDHHFNLDGQKVWTGRVLQIMKDKGWFPWGP